MMEVKSISGEKTMCNNQKSFQRKDGRNSILKSDSIIIKSTNLLLPFYT